jgi:hypothetical protein
MTLSTGASEPESVSFAAEPYRIAGATLIAQAKVAEAEDHFRRAIEVAKTQGARIWELRATANLAVLLDQQGKRAEARAMLAEVYGCFTEGFDSPDLKDAKALLDEAKRRSHRSAAIEKIPQEFLTATDCSEFRSVGD